MNVNLYEKKLSNPNKKSLFLKISGNGKPVREYLKMFIYTKPKNALEKAHNAETLEQAETIRAKKQLILQAQSHGLVSKQMQGLDFVQYFEAWFKDYKSKYQDWKKVEACLVHFKGFLYSKNIRLLTGKNMTKVLCEDFGEYLNGKVKGVSADSYFKKFRRVLRRAYDEGMLNFHPTDVKVKFFIDRKGMTKKLLSEEEIEKMSNTPWPDNPVVAKAYLFCYNIGFDYKTVHDTLRWKHIDEDRWVRFDRSKTERNKDYYINDNALQQLPERGKPNDLVFELPSWYQCIKTIRSWAKRAGVDKKITWHSARHSLASNLINNHKVGIRVVQEILGHDNVTSTMRYANVKNETKKDAVQQLKKLPVKNL